MDLSVTMTWEMDMYTWPSVRCVKITEIWVHIGFYIHLTPMSQLGDILAHSSKDWDSRN